MTLGEVVIAESPLVLGGKAYFVEAIFLLQDHSTFICRIVITARSLSRQVY